MYDSAMHTPSASLAALIASRDKSAAALTEIRSRASLTEKARVDAEAEHAQRVADALIAGEKLPSKPALLSAAQSADDATDAALVLIEQRHTALAIQVEEAASAELADHIAAADRVRLEQLATAVPAFLSAGQLIAELASPEDLKALCGRITPDPERTWSSIWNTARSGIAGTSAAHGGNAHDASRAEVEAILSAKEISK
jgi:hypothetical protein